MTDSKNDPLSDLLSSFALGPAWARDAGNKEERKTKPVFKGEDRPPRKGDRKGGPRDREDDRRSFKGRGGKFDDRRNGPPRREEAPPAEGVRVTLSPDQEAVHLIGKEIHQVARVYPLYDVAKILLAERKRCRAIFEAPAPHAPLFRGKLDDSVFLTKEEAVRHLWQSDLRNQFIEEETIEVDPPTGNFQSVARCGLSGEWLGPPNFHSYQVNLRRLHRERFANMPFATYAAKVRTERSEEAVNAWLETMKQKTRWRLKGDADEAWIEDRGEAERALASRCFDQAFEETHNAEVLASLPAKNLSPSLLTSLKLASNHVRNHPAILIPAICRALEAEHLPVFKRQGKLFTGPARPHPLPLNATLAERPGIMVAWIRENKPAKLEGLWKAVLPEGSTAPPAEFAADLFWLLNQGHILLFTDDTLVVQEVREAPAAEPGTEGKTGKKKKKKKNKAAAPAGEVTASSEESPEPSAETPAEGNPPEDSPTDQPSETEGTEELPPEMPVGATAEPLAESTSNPAEEVSIAEDLQEPAEAEPTPTTPESDESEELSKKPSAGVDDTSAL